MSLHLTPYLLEANLAQQIGVVAIGLGVLMILGAGVMLVKCYQKVEQGTAIVRNGFSGSKVSFAGIFVIPIIHRAERMEISVKRVEIKRTEGEGLICKDNLRADTKVAFFVRVNKTPQDVLKVAQSVGCQRASDELKLRELFDAKFSEALKTVGKKFDFVELYEERERFKDEILKVIGTDLNGYVLDDCAIDYLEQTSVEQLDANNILDAEGIKKITQLTADQQVLANEINREKEKTITKQDVEAREAILELERQQIEAEARQKREVDATQAREQAEAKKVQEEERLKSERARIAVQEEIEIAEQNRLRSVIVAEKSKDRTAAIENERIEKDRLLEVTERERVVELARIEKDKSLEVEKKNIQDVIRDRVVVERAVVEEEQKILDTEALATADRQKQVAIKAAEEDAEQAKIREIKAAEAAKVSADIDAERKVVEADADLKASERNAEAKKVLADARAAEEAAVGLSEAQVMSAKATALQEEGSAQARVLELKAEAEARGIEQKAEAMEKLNQASREHEEYRLKLAFHKDLELAEIEARERIAEYQSRIVGSALESAKIEIVGGESKFFDQITSAVGRGKSIDRWVENSEVLSDVKQTFFNGDAENFKAQLQGLIGRLGIASEDIKNLSVSALLTKLMSQAHGPDLSQLRGMLELAERTGISNEVLNMGDLAETR